jgi:hypothetical protein
MEKELIEAIDSLKSAVQKLTESTDRLYTIQNDIFNVDTSHDDIVSLKGRLKELIDVINQKL